MFRGYKSALCMLSSALLFAGCYTPSRNTYGGLYNAPIPQGINEKDDILNHIRPDVVKRAKDMYDGLDVRSNHIIPGSNTKISPHRVKVHVPWEKLDNMFTLD